MIAARSVFFCLVLMIFLCSCHKQPVSPESRASDEQAIRAIENKLSDAIAARDLEKLVSLYADDAGLYDEHTPTIRGKNAIREAWQSMFARPGLTLTTESTNVEIAETGDLGWGHGIVTIKNQDNPRNDAGVSREYALVYMKSSGGGWSIMADCIHSSIHNYLFPQIAKSTSPVAAAFAPLIGIACFLCGIWFLFGMPIVLIVQIWKWFRGKKQVTGILISAAMVGAFLITAVLLWHHFTAQEWNLPLWALRAATDTARYGNPVEDTSEDILVSLLVLSTVAAVLAGALTGLARRVYTALPSKQI